MTTTTTFADLQQAADTPSLIRKIQQAVAYIAPMETDMPERLTETGGQLKKIPAEWKPVGLVTTDGWEFGTETSKEEVESLGYASPTRSDITKVVKTVKATLQETGKKHILELIYGTDLGDVKQDKTTGEIIFDEPQIPISKEYRLLVLGSDGPADNQWVLGLGFSRAKVTELPSATWAGGSELKYSVSFDVYSDDQVGSAVRHYIGGSAAVKAKDSLGFEQSA